MKYFKYMQILSALLVLFLSTISFSDTGDFKIKSQDFMSLFNEHQFGQANPVPWAGSYWAYGYDGIADAEYKPSPATKYDEEFKQKKASTKWEKENHSCKNVGEEYKEGCKAWWGHCNAWSAAAIIEPEPVQPTNGFRVEDLKAYYTEIWMSSDALFAGDTQKELETDKSWVCDPKNPKAKQKNDNGVTNYQAFWDVTPRDFFLIFTNYLGILSQGLVIDRFTGDQVWNQPIVAYKFADLKKGSSFGKTEEIDGKTLYPVKLKVTFYWANDGVEGGFISAKFDLEHADELLQKDKLFSTTYEARTLAFTLFLNAPIQMENGKITSAGKIIGDGVWESQEKCEHLSLEELDQGHPDFIWKPTKLIPDQSGGEANPYIEAKTVSKIVGDNPGPGPGPVPEEEETVFKISIAKGSCPSENPATIKRTIKDAFKKANIKNTIVTNSFEVAGNIVVISVMFFDKIDPEAIGEALKAKGLEVTNVEQIQTPNPE